MDDDIVTVSVSYETDKEDSKEEDGIKWHRTERQRAYKKRAIRMPEDADLTNATAKYENGVLLVNVPKLEELPIKHHSVEVQ